MKIDPNKKMFNGNTMSLNETNIGLTFHSIEGSLSYIKKMTEKNLNSNKQLLNQIKSLLTTVNSRINEIEKILKLG